MTTRRNFLVSIVAAAAALSAKASSTCTTVATEFEPPADKIKGFAHYRSFDRRYRHDGCNYHHIPQYPQSADYETAPFELRLYAKLDLSDGFWVVVRREPDAKCET